MGCRLLLLWMACVMNRQTVVSSLLANRSLEPQRNVGSAFAPANIALCKYWGKRNIELNLPVTSSLSVSLGELGATTEVSVLVEGHSDHIVLNGKVMTPESNFAQKVSEFLNLFRAHSSRYFSVKTHTNIPVGAGLASSASGFAALALALDQLFAWELPLADLSIFGRLGSGSAVRSFWPGFVEWQLGERIDGLDSIGVPLDETWPTLCVGLWIVNEAEKKVSSRLAMRKTVETSPFYASWPKKQKEDTARMRKAIQARDFQVLGSTAESNALAMHALMLSTSPPIVYSEGKTIEAMQKIWKYREQGLPVFFTQDAGPNLKLLFLEEDRETIQTLFPKIKIVTPFCWEKSNVS